jgi:serine/threonine-protein kinase
MAETPRGSRRAGGRSSRRLGTGKIADVYRRLSELVQTKGYLSIDEARDLLEVLDGGKDLGTVGDYYLLRVLGEGATACVYQAVHARTRRLVSLKVLAREALDDPEIHRHFVREAKAVMLLRHPNIVRGIEIGDTDEDCFIALEYVDGRTLRDLVGMLGTLGEFEAIHILRQVALALEYTHRCDMVHLDIKPENILIDDNTLEAKLFDLGMLRDRTDPDIATIVEAPVHPRYSSPEMLTGQPSVDVRSDIYSLGLCTFFMLTGKHAFLGPRNPLEVEADRADVERRLREVEPEISEPTIQAVLSMVEYRFRDRPENPAELLDLFPDVDPFGHV